MLFPAVTELFGHLARLPALDEAFEALRRGSPAEELAGLTNPAKALVVALAATELRRPILVLVEDERRAASLLEPLQFFHRTLSGNSAGPVLLLPALDKLKGSSACAAEYWMFFLPKRRSLCASSFSEIRLRRCANLIPRRSVPRDR
jgi:hypothetical protein